MWKFRFLLFAIVGISVGSAAHLETQQEFKDEYAEFDDKQSKNMQLYADTYKNEKLYTFEKIVKHHTVSKQELTTDLNTLKNLSDEANIDENDELARIGQKFKKQQIIMDSFQNATTFSKDFRYNTVVFLIQKESSPIVTILKKTLIDLMTMTPTTLQAQEKLYKHLYDFFGEKYEPFYLRIQAEMDIVEDYYENPKFFSETSIAKINKLMKKIRESMKKWVNVNEVESREDLDSLMELFPEFLQSLDDLNTELKLAKVNCDLVRCTKHPEK